MIKPIEIRNNKKGSLMDLFVWLIISFVIVIFFVLWVYMFNLLTVEVTAIKSTESLNISDAAAKSFGRINAPQTSGLHLLAFVMIFGMGLSILITNFMVKAHPAFFIVYIFITIVAIILAVIISNQYETLMSNAILGDTIKGFKGASFIMLQLPLWTTIIGIFGAVFLFAGILRDRGLGGSVV